MLDSPVFSASPDNIPHNWEVQKTWNPEDPDFYGVAVALVSHPQWPISMKFSCQVFGGDGHILYEREMDEMRNSCFIFKKENAWGFSLIERKKYKIPQISKISFTIDLYRV